jgi:hypothetical protein
MGADMTPDRSPLDELAAAPLDDEDARTLDRIARLYAAADPLPAGLTERIAFGITLDALQAEVAELQRDEQLSGARADPTTAAQTVTFTSPSITLMITITVVSPERARIDGWVVPGAGATVEVRSTAGRIDGATDDHGRIAFPDVARGLVRFVVHPPAGSGTRPVVTPAIEI